MIMPKNRSITSYSAEDYGLCDIADFSWDAVGEWTLPEDKEKFSHFAINEAIETACAAGGGTVVVPSGVYLVG